MQAEVTITYEDGSAVRVDASKWPIVRADGVQDVVVRVGRLSTRIHASSIYWLYPEEGHYVVGGGSVRYDPNPLTEIIIAPDGTQRARRVEFMPDLKHEQIKLGWWKRG